MLMRLGNKGSRDGRCGAATRRKHAFLFRSTDAALAFCVAIAVVTNPASAGTSEKAMSKLLEWGGEALLEIAVSKIIDWVFSDNAPPPPSLGETAGSLADVKPWWSDGQAPCADADFDFRRPLGFENRRWNWRDGPAKVPAYALLPFLQLDLDFSAATHFYFGVGSRDGRYRWPKDVNMAAKCLAFVANRGYPPAERMLGYMYISGQTGNGLSDWQRKERFFALEKDAASQGEATAKY